MKEELKLAIVKETLRKFASDNFYICHRNVDKYGYNSEDIYVSPKLTPATQLKEN